MSPSPASRALATLAALAALTTVAAACGEDDATSDAAAASPASPARPAGAAERERPEVVFAAGGPTMELPDEVPSGLVDLRIQATDDGQAHLLIGRLNDGVTYEEFETAPPDAAGLEMVTVVGGNGTIAPGEESLLTVDLEPGDYSAVNIYFPDPTGPPQFAYDRFTVEEGGTEAGGAAGAAAEPEADGTITMGPGMRIDVPDEFEGSGTWRFENADDQQAHEAALVQLTDGSTVEDLIEWFHAPQGPPPIAAEIGAMGALGPGQEAWMTLDELEPGDYALVCFVPGADGVQHVTNGMVSGFTVGAG